MITAPVGKECTLGSRSVRVRVTEWWILGLHTYGEALVVGGIGMEMSDWERPLHIERRHHLNYVLGVVRDAVNSGELVQTYPSHKIGATSNDIRDIPPDGPWPDDILAWFRESSTGRVFRLDVDVYHGSGGSWGLDSEVEEQRGIVDE